MTCLVSVTYGIKNKGKIKIGYDADLVVLIKIQL